MSKTFRVLDEKDLDKVNGGVLMDMNLINARDNLVHSTSDTPGVNNAVFDTSDKPVATNVDLQQGSRPMGNRYISGGTPGQDMA